jgi:hypothetical protein
MSECCYAVAAAAAVADGWGFSQMQSSNSLKMSVIGGIHAVHYFRGAFLLAAAHISSDYSSGSSGSSIHSRGHSCGAATAAAGRRSYTPQHACTAAGT